MSTPSELSAMYIEAFNTRNDQQMWQLLSSEVVYRIGGAPPFTGIERVRASYQDALASDVQAVTTSLTEQGDTVFIENTLTGSLPSKESYSIDQVVKHRWRDGLLVEYRNYNDPPLIEGEPVTFEHLTSLLANP